MVGTSKILTVSYGTFSCTLEGFDDSFNTMKAIAEYFRGLAADDRYFGAEPPTPDAEMLASIAQREISRRVEAHEGEDGIHLRAAAISDQSEASDDAQEHDAESRAKVEEDRKAAKAERQAEKAKAKAERDVIKAERRARKAARAAAAKEAEAEAAAKVQADAKAADAAKEADANKSVDAEAKSSGDGVAEAQSALDEAALEAGPSDDTSILESVGAATAAASEGTSGSDVEETRDDAPSSMLAAEDPVPENTGPENTGPENTGAENTGAENMGAELVEDSGDAADVPAHPDADSVAAKLQRIRAVVGNANEDDVSAADDPNAQFLPLADAPDVADNADAVAEFDAHEAEVDQAGMETSGDVQADTSADIAADTPLARVIRMKRADMIATPDAEKPAGPDLGLLDGAEELDDYLEDSDYTDADATPLEDTDLAQDLQAFEETPENGAEPTREDTAIEAVSGLMSTQEDDVETAVDEVETEAEIEEAAEAVVDQADNGASSEAAPGFLAEDPQVDDEALDRLMSETDAQMSEPEGSRRRDAIAQLKAAVAAKEAARQVGEPEDDGQDVENAFRNDLSEAVGPDEAAGIRPRPVVRNSTRTERPRPAPLKLVAAQRVDLPETEQRDGPVVPRRVAARKDDAVQTQAAGSFAEFAENMGASELPDLLEAAAAYTSFVEGADEFSRPQILRRVRTVASDDFNREDGLRSFADLLRIGRFTKVRNGRFQVADDSRFNPERRAS